VLYFLKRFWSLSLPCAIPSNPSICKKTICTYYFINFYCTLDFISLPTSSSIFYLCCY
jgi:hypothetical protein